ncbi:MAG: cyclic 2,3-diphosphoglycerate synthase [Actinomycetota bacterium]|jgi:cyclic 2,3-diphosphoglycerate synthetase|nr:cyclic 2,3-diphosphoglycerate synthase [Actinomycetota bacterium]
MRTLVLVDGEHYPPVSRWAIEVARERGYDVVAALLVGGSEKLGPGETPDLGVDVRVGGTDRMRSLREAIEATKPAAILDLSDEPVLGYRERMELIGVSLVAGIPYIGPDFRFEPPDAGPPLRVPTLAVIGTGKRTGKTAIAGEVARVADGMGLSPVVVAMGRGGPAEPQVAEPGSVDLERLLELLGQGEHASSDYLEDALTTGVATVGARRAGGGLAGAPFASTVREAAALAAERPTGLVILEGSGAAVPPVPWDAAVLVIPAAAPPEYVGGYLGPYRLLRSDLAVVTMSSGPSGPEHLSSLRSHVRRFLDDERYLVTDFVPKPLADVAGRRVFFTTTAPEAVAADQASHLAKNHGCEIVGWSSRLADRAGLTEDLQRAGRFEVLLTELKAAAVDIACGTALSLGAEVVFVDNRAVVREGKDLSTALRELIQLARERASRR